MNFNKIIEYFIPKKYLNDKELNRKSRFVIWFVIITSIIGIFFSLLVLFSSAADITSLILGSLMPLVMFLALLHFRSKGSFIITTHIICSFSVLALVTMPNSTGGLYSPDLPTIYIVPLFALFLGNFRISIFYSILSLLGLLGYYLVSLNNSSFYKDQFHQLHDEYFISNLILNMIMIIFLVFRNEKLRLTLLGELKETNLIISQKSKEITDSINYAKRIQTAILPENATVKDHLPDSFIVYLPKDIVSGDFYWLVEKGGFQFIAVADCTGHGVPGALMSVIGVNQLNDIVQEKAILDPSQILEALNRNVNKILKQNQAEINDGMDIAVLKINLKEKTLEYAGANRPLYHVRNKQLAEIKATKTPIGGVELGKEKIFGSTLLQLQAGDMIYLSTDGYADQFGGAKNKKITTKKFKLMLETIAELPLPEQEKYLLDFFKSFKAGNEQTDDVLLAGLRF